MGIRLSLKLLPREKWEEIRHKDWSDENNDIWEEIHQLEDVAWDYCTDAFNYSDDKMHQLLTDQALESEEDVFMGVMDKDNFERFLESIKEKVRTYNEIPTSKIMFRFLKANVKDKWRLCDAWDWPTALYNGFFIMKMMDWEKNILYVEIG